MAMVTLTPDDVFGMLILSGLLVNMLAQILIKESHLPTIHDGRVEQTIHAKEFYCLLFTMVGLNKLFAIVELNNGRAK